MKLTKSLNSVPDREDVEERLSGMLAHAVPGIDDGPAADGGRPGHRARLRVTQHHHVGIAPHDLYKKTNCDLLTPYHEGSLPKMVRSPKAKESE